MRILRSLLIVMAVGLVMPACSSLGPDVTEPVEILDRDMPRFVSQKRRFDVLTYNVAGIPWGFSRSKPGRNAKFIGPLLERYDVVLLQEDFSYNDEIFEGRTHAFRTRARQGRLLPVSDGLSRLSRLEMHDVRRVRWDDYHGLLSSGSDGLANKGFSVSRAWLASDAYVDVYNLHADAGRGSNDVATRRDQFRQLADHIREHSSDAAVIVAGDFNARWISRPDRECLAEFTAATGLKDVCEGDLADWRVDHIFYRSGRYIDLQPTRFGVDPQFRDRFGRALSDHPPVWARFTWRPVL